MNLGQEFPQSPKNGKRPGFAPGFARDIYRGSIAEVQILVDGANSNTAGIVSNYISQAVVGYAGAVQRRQMNARLMARAPDVGSPAPAGPGGLTLQNRVWFNPDLRSHVYFVPGVIVKIIAPVTIMLTAMSIVREKEIGTMEQLMVTPLRPREGETARASTSGSAYFLDAML